METKSFTIYLNNQDAQRLSEIAESLKTSETEVIRTGLQLVSLYEQNRKYFGGVLST